MALQKQLVPLPIDKGLDTKLDPKQEEIGFLRKAQNLVYETIKMLRKRNGYTQVDLYTTAEVVVDSPIKLAKFKDELLILTESNLYSYSQTRERVVDKGTLFGVSSVTQNIIKNSNNQSQVDGLTLQGFNIFTWKDSVGGVRYSVQDLVNDSFLVSNAQISATGERPVLAHIEGYVFVIYGDGATIKFKRFSILEPEILTAPITATSDRHTTLGLIDAESSGSKIVVGYNASNGGNDLSLFTIDEESLVSSIVHVTSESASHALDVMVDGASRVVVTFSDNTQVRYIIFPITLSAAILPATNIETVVGVTTCCTLETAPGIYRTYYEVSVTGVSNNYVKQVNLTVAGVVTGIAVFKRSVGLGARAFIRDSIIYVLTVHESEIQSSYFLFNAAGNMVTKFANQTAASVVTYGVLQPILSTATDQYMIPLIIHNRVVSDNGTFFSTDGIAASILNFAPQFRYSNAQLAEGLHICAGILRFYDGATVTEHGFHVFPELLTLDSPITITTATTTQGVLGVKDVQKLSYSAVPDGGGFTITIGAETTASIGFGDSNATIKSKIEALIAIVTVTVTGSFALGHTITFDDPVSNIAQAIVATNTLVLGVTPVTITPTTITQGVTPVKEVQTIGFSDTPTIGAFTIDIGGEVTAPVNFTQGAPELEAAIEALTGIIAATVTGNFTSGFTITFDDPVSNIAQAVVVLNSLSTTAATGELSDGTRAYVAVYRWTDNNGRDHRSTPTLTPLEVVLQGGTSTQQTVVNVPTLRITDKTNVVLELYRTEDAGTTYYKVTDDLNPVLNDQTVDSIAITDTMSDTELISQEILYTTGGVLENIAAPAASQISTYNGDRLVVVGEDTNRIFFSKQVSEGRPVEFTDAIYRDIDPVGGAITTLKAMTDKLLVFSNDAAFYVSGEGPNNLGLSDTMNKPEIISTDIGCTSPDSAVLTPIGIMFKSRKGVWLVGPGLGLEYLGARAEQYNSQNITSAAVVGELNQIRFTLDTDRALVYNYQLDKWATFENHGALSAVVIGNDYYYLREDGVLYKEDRTTFSDAGSPIKMRIETGWLSLSELQGYQRAYHMLILGSFKSAHKLRVKVAYDFEEAWVQEVLINTADFVDAEVYGADPTYGDSSPYGGNGSLYQMRVDFKRQKCESVKILIEDAQDVASEGLSLSSISIRAGAKEGSNKLSVIHKFGTR